MRWLPLFAVVLMLAGCGPAEQAAGSANGDLDGGALYLDHCAVCHGYDARGTDRGPDLHWRVRGMSVEEIADVIILGQGAMKPLDLDDDEADTVAFFLLDVLVAE